MRILVLTTSFPHTVEDPAGHFVRAAARSLVASGHEVHVVAAGGSPFDLPREEAGLTIHWAGGSSLFGWPGAVPRAREAPWRLAGGGAFLAGAYARLRAIGPVDRIVAHWIVPCAYPLALALPNGRGTPLYVVAHGGDVRLLLAAPRVAREHVIAQLLGRGAHFVFAARALLDALLISSISTPLANQLSAVAKVEAPAIDVPEVASRAAALRASMALREGEILVVTAGRLIPSKRVSIAIEAARALPGVRLVVVGDGSERSALERLAAGDRATIFTGALPRKEALAWVAAADVLVHPSAVEAAPTVVREARALAIPVVACDAGDVRAWAHDDPGIVVADGTAAAFAGALATQLAARRVRAQQIG